MKYCYHIKQRYTDKGNQCMDCGEIVTEPYSLKKMSNKKIDSLKPKSLKVKLFNFKKK